MENKTISNFLTAFNNEDNSERHRHLQLCFLEDGTYIDPECSKKMNSLNELHFYINQFRLNISDRISLIGQPEFHNHHFRFKIKAVKKDSSTFFISYVGELKKDKIKTIIGFNEN